MAKVSDVDGLSLKAMDVGVSEEDGESGDQESTGGVRLKKELSLLNGVAIIVGVILGSGIFATPNYVLEHAGSKGMALVVWVLSGMLSMVGALCYAELGTMIPMSGGDYAYIGEAFGPLLAFLYLWVAFFILVPTGNAITALIFAINIIKPLWPECQPPLAAVSLIAASITCFLTVINCYNVKWVTRVQDLFTAAKVLALVIIFFASLWYLFAHDTENLSNMMQGTKNDPGEIAIAFYTGLFSFSGWNYLNFVTEELKNPYKNLPRAICISMPVVILIYALINVAFFAVLTKQEILASDTIAITFGDKMLGFMSFIMPLFVALCTLGSLNGAIYASSRLFFVGAKNGHLPLAISLINIKRLTPVPSLIFMCVITLLLLVSTDVESLIVYLTAVEGLFTICSIAGLLWLRRAQPQRRRPIRINLFFPVTYLILCPALIIASCFQTPMQVGIGIAIVLLGIPIYGIFIVWENKPIWFQSACNSFNILCQKMFLSLPEDSKDL